MSTKKILQDAQKSFYKMSKVTSAQKREALLKFANLIIEKKDFLLSENEKDLHAQRHKLSKNLFERLKLDEPKIKVLADGIRDIANFDDPVGKLLSRIELDTNLTLSKISVPIGVIGVIFESRPDVIPQILALILKSGNVAILKGGSEAAHSNKAFMKVVNELSYLPKNWAQLVVDRKSVHEMLKYPEYINLIIPRGSNKLVQSIMKATKIPVLGHADGICHVYVEKSADLQMAQNIIIDAKTQYPSACNSMETLLIDRYIAPKFLPKIAHELESRGVKLFGDSIVKKLYKKIRPVKKWNHEYGDLACAIKIVQNTDEAILHINTYGSHHTDSIVSQDSAEQAKFVNELDSANILINASTRFADGYRFGMGAEVGISTNRTHARGPVGIEGLVIYKYVVQGNGQVVADYFGNNAKPFLHNVLK